jgi:hypothetical protein
VPDPTGPMILCSWVDAVLREQLLRAERKSVSGAPGAPQKSNLKSTSSIYWSQSFDERQRGHEQIRAAIRRGAIEAKWAEQGGEERPLEWVRVQDMGVLAELLGVATNLTVLTEATTGLAGWIGRCPHLQDVINAWARLRRVRGLGPDSWRTWSDASMVLNALKSTPDTDIPVRVLSAQLFTDSKYIEGLTAQLDVLSGNGISAIARKRREVLNALGLVKQPMPILIAGKGRIIFEDGPSCDIPRPYVGFEPRSIRGYLGTPSWVMTVENLTTFHLVAQALKARQDGLVVFTGGMPSPAWVSGFRSLTAELQTATFYHWGDVDLGGFRIAAHLREVALPAGVVLHPWLMHLTISGVGKPTSDGTRDAMRAAAARAGWESIGELPALTLEQENTPVSIPTELSAKTDP